MSIYEKLDKKRIDESIHPISESELDYTTESNFGNIRQKTEQEAKQRIESGLFHQVTHVVISYHATNT